MLSVLYIPVTLIELIYKKGREFIQCMVYQSVMNIRNDTICMDGEGLLTLALIEFSPLTRTNMQYFYICNQSSMNLLHYYAVNPDIILVNVYKIFIYLRIELQKVF